MTDATALTLRRPRPARALISLVAMIDVLLILLVFFMVTSTYLDLDMIPAVSQDSEASSGTTESTTAQPLLVRIGADGAPVIRGQPIEIAALDALLRERRSASPTFAVMILPTGVANAQALIRVMDTATQAGVRNIRVIRLEGRP